MPFTLWLYSRNVWLIALLGYLLTQTLTDFEYNKVVIFIIQLSSVFIRSIKNYFHVKTKCALLNINKDYSQTGWAESLSSSLHAPCLLRQLQAPPLWGTCNTGTSLLAVPDLLYTGGNTVSNLLEHTQATTGYPNLVLPAIRRYTKPIMPYSGLQSFFLIWSPDIKFNTLRAPITCNPYMFHY